MAVVLYMVEDGLAIDPTPTKGSESATGWDVRCVKAMALDLPSWVVKIPIGIRIAPPPGIGFQVRGRSGLAASGVFCHFGTIDNDYRGQIEVVLFSVESSVPVPFAVGDRIAQLVLEGDPFRPIEWRKISKQEFESLSTSRGDGGFGSTGTN